MGEKPPQKTAEELEVEAWEQAEVAREQEKERQLREKDNHPDVVE